MRSVACADWQVTVQRPRRMIPWFCYSSMSGYCAGTIAQAVRPAVHDVTDGSVMRSWLNSPLSNGLEADIYKATNILNSFAQVGYLQPEKGIPAAVLQGAAGFAILSVAKVSMSACDGDNLQQFAGDHQRDIKHRQNSTMRARVASWAVTA